MTSHLVSSRQLPPRTVALRCDHQHEHLVGDIQAKRILRDVCPWCHTPLHVALRWKDGKVTVAARA
jgi:hypothetical protein